MSLLLKKEKLIDNLKILNDYYLLGDGQFFQIFAEESQKLMSLPRTKKAENEINHYSFLNAKLRLNYDSNKLFLQNLKFKLQKNGFEFEDFSKIQGLNIAGNISLIDKKFLRFRKHRNMDSALWYNLKQNIEQGFILKFNVRFKTSKFL